MAHTTPKIKKVVKKNTPNEKKSSYLKPAHSHECHATGCHIKIWERPDKKYCSDKCRKIMAQEKAVGEFSSRYRPEYATGVDSWLKQFKGVKFEKIPTGEVRYEGTGKKKKKVNVYRVIAKADIPTIGGYAQHIGYTKRTLYNWAKQYEQFQTTLDKILEKKEQLINEYGLSGFYSSQVVKLHLMSDHDMKEKTESDNKTAVFALFKQVYEKADQIESERNESSGN